MSKSVTIATMLFCCAVLGAALASDEYDAEQAIEDCSKYLLDLANCLRGEQRMLLKIEQCNQIMAGVFVCMSKYPDETDAQSQDEVVVKRGLGRCINQCLQGQMNFIQCKSICHR